MELWKMLVVAIIPYLFGVIVYPVYFTLTRNAGPAPVKINLKRILLWPIFFAIDGCRLFITALIFLPKMYQEFISKA